MAHRGASAGRTARHAHLPLVALRSICYRETFSVKIAFALCNGGRAAQGSARMCSLLDCPDMGNACAFATTNKACVALHLHGVRWSSSL